MSRQGDIMAEQEMEENLIKYYGDSARKEMMEDLYGKDEPRI